jgi:hypothetical protein
MAIKIENEDCLKILLENGFDLKYLGNEGNSLHLAIIYLNKNILKILLDYNQGFFFKLNFIINF